MEAFFISNKNIIVAASITISIAIVSWGLGCIFSINISKRMKLVSTAIGIVALITLIGFQTDLQNNAAKQQKNKILTLNSRITILSQINQEGNHKINQLSLALKSANGTLQKLNNQSLDIQRYFADQNPIYFVNNYIIRVAHQLAAQNSEYLYLQFILNNSNNNLNKILTTYTNLLRIKVDYKVIPTVKIFNNLSYDRKLVKGSLKEKRIRAIAALLFAHGYKIYSICTFSEQANLHFKLADNKQVAQSNFVQANVELTENVKFEDNGKVYNMDLTPLKLYDILYSDELPLPKRIVR